jgi:1-acyl-sn-glycerol-3-phosphate acyltransferase
MGIKIAIRGADALDPGGTYLYISNHVNIFDTFAIYQAIPHDARGLEHIDHFSWPIIGPFLKSVGQIPVDPHDHRSTAKGLRQATKMLKQGKSIVVLPEGSRTLDGTVGHFFPGAFRLAISASVPVVPIAIRGGRAVSRRGEWRIRPGREELLVGAPVPTVGMRQKDAAELSKTCRSIIIDLLQGRRAPGH